MKYNERKEEILDAAIEVVSEQTIGGTRLRMIADRANVVQSSIHYYFRDKDALMKKLQQRIPTYFKEHRRKMRAQYNPELLEDQIELFIRQKLDIMQNMPDYDFIETDLWLQTKRNPELKEQMRISYSEWREEIRKSLIDHFAPELPEEKKQTLAYIIVALLQGAVPQYHLEEFDLDAYAKYCKRIIRSSLKDSMDE